MLKINVKKLPKSEVEIEAELDADIFEKYWDKALKKIGENIEIPGFRKGKAPENVLLSKISEAQILTEMADLALNEHYPKILEENKIDAISRPEISITKLARKNPLGFKIKVAVMPLIDLPDYKKIAKKVISEIKNEDKNFEATEKEIADTIMDIRKSRAPKKHIKDLPAEEEGEAEKHIHKESETHEHQEKKPIEIKEDLSAKAEDLPPFNDEFVQALGPFKDIADFTEKLKANIKLEKENQLREKTRLKIVEKIIEDLKVELPEILIEVELNKIIYRMESDITQMGLKFEDYLKHLGKTIKDLKNEFRNDAEKKAKLGLALNKIAEVEKIFADKEQVEREVAQILEIYKDADKERATIHAENVLINEKVFQFLEEQK